MSQHDYIPEPPSQTFERLWDERSVYIDLDKVYSYQKMFDNENKTDLNVYQNTLIRGIHEKNFVNQLFFSKKNIDNLEKRLRYTVFLMSRKQYVLGPQDKTELVIIMRSVYLLYSNSLNVLVKDQIKKLNDIVISKSAPRLLSQVTQYLRYLEDANESHKILIARPINATNNGLRVLPMGNALGFGNDIIL